MLLKSSQATSRSCLLYLTTNVNCDNEGQVQKLKSALCITRLRLNWILGCSWKIDPLYSLITENIFVITVKCLRVCSSLHWIFTETNMYMHVYHYSLHSVAWGKTSHTYHIAWLNVVLDLCFGGSSLETWKLHLRGLCQVKEELPSKKEYEQI